MKLSDQQVHALGVIYSTHVEVGMETLCGVGRQTARSLERHGLLATKGARHPE